MKDWYTEKRVSRSIFGSILEYEYLYLNGELDIDCIYLKKRREHIGTYKVADMEALFPLDAKRFREYRKDKNIKIRGCSAGRRGMRYGMLIPRAEQKDLLIFEPDQGMLLDMQRRSPGKVQFA